MSDIRNTKALERIATALERIATAAEAYADRDPMKLMEDVLRGDESELLVPPEPTDDIPAPEAWRFR